MEVKSRVCVLCVYVCVAFFFLLLMPVHLLDLFHVNCGFSNLIGITALTSEELNNYLSFHKIKCRFHIT